MQDVDGIGTAGDAVGAHPAQARPDVLAKTDIAADEIALQVGAAETEIGVCEGIDGGIRLQVFVAGVDVPIPEMLDLPVADRDAAEPTLIAAVEGTGRVAAIRRKLRPQRS